MAEAKPAGKLTYDELLAFPDDGKRWELVDGEPFLMPAPTVSHQRATICLAFLLESYLRERGEGLLLLAPCDVVLSDFDVLQPDLLVVTEERMGIVTDPNIQGAPDLAVEVLSPGTRRRDLDLKRALYGRFGVREYWIVDTEAHTVTVHRRGGDRLERVARLSVADGDAVETPLLPGLVVDLGQVFRR